MKDQILQETSDSKNVHLKWYAIHIQSGCENKVSLSLQERIKQENLEPEFGQILIPMESIVETANGQQRTAKKKIYPGYMFIQMVLNEHTYHLVKNTPKVTGFLGGKKPVPLGEESIQQVMKQISEGSQKPKTRLSFEAGDNVRVIDGPFSNLSGIIDEARADKQKLKVRVSIFGRAASVELDYAQVEKIS